MTAVVPELPPRAAAPEHRYRTAVQQRTGMGYRTGIRVAAVPAGHVYARHVTALTLHDPVQHLPGN
ncbi:hypothetical protein [Streptomyces sp. 1331.2]|uniref:hypothetical protein n=1 Tax=Streptomyces sp. 1331.2 TaxID=1938835 RepID=UPI000BD52424|nr:hypothetical protein [Streptomyces sp. 1331.2]SOB88524.1 hypothetical protein SAMN06272789_6809 [Streptomyces sp. 1331.2]